MNTMSPRNLLTILGMAAVAYTAGCANDDSASQARAAEARAAAKAHVRIGDCLPIKKGSGPCDPTADQYSCYTLYMGTQPAWCSEVDRVEALEGFLSGKDHGPLAGEDREVIQKVRPLAQKMYEALGAPRR